MNLYHLIFPFSARDAGVPGLAKPRPMTTEEKVASAASYLAKHAAEQRRKARSTRIAEHIAEMKASPVSPIAPREVVVAGVYRPEQAA